MGEMMEMFKKALEMRNAGLEPNLVGLADLKPKQATNTVYVKKEPIYKPPATDQKLLASGDGWDGVELWDGEVEFIE